MKGSLRWRIILTLIVALLAVLYVAPTFTQGPDSSKGGILPDKKINLGLDLMGGIHLTLGVEVEKALENKMARMGQDIRSFARDEEIVILRPSATKNTVSFFLLKQDDQLKLEDMIADNFSNALNIESAEKLDDGKVRYTLSMKKEYRKYIADLALDQAVKTIRNRIDQFGVAEPDIRKQREDFRIQIQLPGLKDPERAIDLLKQTAHLEFKLVDDKADPEGRITPDLEVLPMMRRLADGSYAETKIVVQQDAQMTGEYITDARINYDSYNQPYVGLTFNSRGAKLFERITGDNIKKRLAIVLDNKVYSAPVIQDRIAGGRAQITGSFSIEEARDLAIVLRAGSLPAPVKILEERSVGPSLGQESIDKGIRSALVGFGLVLIFMVIYFGFAGLVADVVLALNILLIMAGLSAFGATLTLPGIAGIILTIGMAVDANVLIFERIREELRKGLTVKAAVDEGFSRATLTILDANVTTIIAAVILYQFGTGPIRGFAVTLTLGILSSMFTAIFVSRIFFDMWTSRKRVARLSI